MFPQMTSGAKLRSLRVQTISLWWTPVCNAGAV